MVTMGGFPLWPDKPMGPGELKSRIDALVRKIPESDRVLATVCIETHIETIYGDTEGEVDLSDVRAYPVLLVRYPKFEEEPCTKSQAANTSTA